MINWISSKDEETIKRIDINSLKKVVEFLKSMKSNDEYVNYVCKIYDEYENILSEAPNTLKSNIFSLNDGQVVIDGDLSNSDIIISPSDLNAYYTIKDLNEKKFPLTVVCFDMHSDTYDYNDFLWKGNSFSKLMMEGYINHFIVVGVPKDRRQIVLDDTNEDLLNRVHLIDNEDLFTTLNKINNENIFISIDADCFDCRKSRYTAVEYSPSTILLYLSQLTDINKNNYKEKVMECIHVKNELGYSNYYKTGENNLTIDNVIKMMNDIIIYCDANDIKLGIEGKKPFFQIMEVSGYDYGNLTSKMVQKLINNFSLKEVRNNEKRRILSKNS